MIDDTDHELLSAYVDGEVTADERQRVEQLLAESAECRQVYEELRALRASLASLPRHELDEDLGPRAIRMAEQVMLGKARMPGDVAPRSEEGELVEAAAGEIASAGSTSAADRRSRAWRAIIYPVLAVAAAVAMMLNPPEKKHKGEGQIAHARVKQAPAAMSAPQGEAAGAESIAQDERALRREAGPTSGFVSDEKMAGKKVGDQPALLTSEERAAPCGGIKSMVKSNAAAVPAAPPALIAGEGHRKAQRMESRQTMLVVTCTLAPAAVLDKAFDALLARHHLVPRSAPELARAKSSKAGEAAPAATEAFSSAELPKKEGDLAQKMTENEILSLGRKDSGWAKSVVVELDAQQLVAVLADLQNHPEQFLSVGLPAQPAEEPEPASDVVATESGLRPDSGADASGAPQPSAGRVGPERLVVWFRLSATGN